MQEKCDVFGQVTTKVKLSFFFEEFVKRIALLLIKIRKKFSNQLDKLVTKLNFCDWQGLSYFISAYLNF